MQVSFIAICILYEAPERNLPCLPVIVPVSINVQCPLSIPNSQIPVPMFMSMYLACRHINRHVKFGYQVRHHSHGRSSIICSNIKTHEQKYQTALCCMFGRQRELQKYPCHEETCKPSEKGTNNRRGIRWPPARTRIERPKINQNT